MSSKRITADRSIDIVINVPKINYLTGNQFAGKIIKMLVDTACACYEQGQA